MRLIAGTRLGAYEVVSLLGSGGMGDVYRARDLRLGREVAVKALPAEFAGDADRLARFRREAQVLASLNHANIATIHGLEETDGLPYLILELIEGESLSERVRRGPVGAGEAVGLAIQIAAAIEAAHERGIVHRDLKPANVMITASGVAKVLDFGLAKSDSEASFSGDGQSSTARTAAPDATRAGMIIGTAAYMSPEQARGRAVDRRSDVWSFGCILFECLAGRPVFSGETVSDLIARILEREPDWSALPTEVPQRVRDVLRRCLRKDPAERPRDIRDVRLELSVGLTAGPRPAGTRETSIAVLPFHNLSGPADEYFADGMTDEILNALAHLDGLRVAARSSCFAFKGKSEDLRTVGEKLDVATVLEGTVRRAGDRLRITVQLANAADGYQLWSERYDRELTDVFAVQDEIAATIASRLVGTMRQERDRTRSRHGTSSVEAYELFLEGRALQHQRGASVMSAISRFERALALDPGYAEAAAWMADSYRLLATYGIANPSEVMPRAKLAAERALAIDPSLAEARATLADIEMQYDQDFARATASWKLALEADPRHSRARCERALWSAAAGVLPLAEALEEIRAVGEADPLNAWVVAMGSIALNFAGRHAEELREAKRALEVDPSSFLAQWSVVRATAAVGDYDSAAALGASLVTSSGRNVWVLSTLAWIHGKAGNVETAQAIFDELEGRSRHEFVSVFWLGVAANSSGYAEEARRYAERAVAERDPLVILARHLQLWEGIRTQPWFDELARKLWP